MRRLRYSNIKEKRVVVTRCAGFIGSNLARALAKDYDYDVIVIDNLPIRHLGLTLQTTQYSRPKLIKKMRIKSIINKTVSSLWEQK